MVKLSTDRKMLYAWDEPTGRFFMVQFIQGEVQHHCQIQRAQDWEERELYRNFVASMPKEHVFSVREHVANVYGGAV